MAFMESMTVKPWMSRSRLMPLVSGSPSIRSMNSLAEMLVRNSLMLMMQSCFSPQVIFLQ